MKREDSEVREIDRLRTRLARMSEVSRLMTERWDLNTVLQAVVDCARSLTDAQYGAVGALDESGHVGEYITSGIAPDPAIEISEDSPRGNVLSVPIRHLGKPVGSICVTGKEDGGEFSEEDEETLVMLAAQAAIAIGYERERLARLFRKFSRIGDDGRDRKVAGEGLGLAICKGIVEAHGGRIWAESDGERPSTRITFTIPEAVVAQAPSGAGLVVAPSDQSRILAVGDEPQALWLLGSPTGWGTWLSTMQTAA